MCRAAKGDSLVKVCVQGLSAVDVVWNVCVCEGQLLRVKGGFVCWEEASLGRAGNSKCDLCNDESL